jgi:glycosyltransferase involved in cell wall biosynthesis
VSGAENHLLELSQRLPEHGWESDILVASPDPSKLAPFRQRLATNCDRVLAIRMRADISPGLLFRLVRLLASGRYALAHAHLVHADWHLAASSFFISRVPLVSTKHNPNPFRRSRSFRLIERALARRYKVLIAISQSLAEFTRETIGVRPVKIHYGLSAPGEPPRPAPRPNGVTTLLGVGRLERQKGFEFAIEAAAILKREYPDTRLLIAGEGRERARLTKLSQRVGARRSVTLLGERTDVAELMQTANVLVHPARWEGFGLVLLEAMRAGLPVVATDVAAIPEIVIDGVTGILVPAENAKELASALARLIRDAEECHAMGAAGYSRLKRRFSPEDMARRTAAVYDAITT